MRILLASLSLLLSACAGVERHAAPRVYAQAFDTETNACLRFPGNCPGAQGLAARQRVAEAGATLGREKHSLALQCIQQKLHAIRPSGFSLNQRYRQNKATEKWEPLSEQQVQVAGSSQGQVYERAFGVNPARVAPRWDIQRFPPK
jgi:hypothetical protein